MNDKYIVENGQVYVKIPAMEYFDILRSKSDAAMTEHLRAQKEMGEVLKAIDVFKKREQRKQEDMAAIAKMREQAEQELKKERETE